MIKSGVYRGWGWWKKPNSKFYIACAIMPNGEKNILMGDTEECLFDIINNKIMLGWKPWSVEIKK